MDQIAIKEGEELDLIRTTNVNTWNLQSRAISFFNGIHAIPGKDIYESMMVSISPSLPYLYLPSSIYDKVIEFVEEWYTITLCDRSKNKCKFDKPCS
jgi:hypothetical protein